MKTSILTIIIIFAVVINCFGQTDSIAQTDTLYHNLSVISNDTSLSVYIDSVYAGKTPLANYRLKSGTYTITVKNPADVKRWEGGVYELKDFTLNNDTVLYPQIKYFYGFRSVPFGVEVYKGTNKLGETPLRLFTETPLTGILTFRKNGFREKTFDMSTYNPEKSNEVILEGNLDKIVFKNRETSFRKERNYPIIAVFSAAAIGSGIGTYYLKTQANKDYDNYTVTLDKSKLDSSNRKDLYSTFSLIFMQAALAGVVYFLFLD